MLARLASHRFPRSNSDPIAELRARELAASEQMFRGAFMHAPVGMARETLDGDILDVNIAFCEMMAMTEAELIGVNWKDLTHPEDLNASARIDASLPDAARVAAGEKRYLRPSGEVRWGLVSLVFLHDSAGERFLLAQVVDITDRKRAELELTRLALHDPLTGLANRVLLESRTEQALARMRRDPSSTVAVLFIDLDGFKAINDRLGHHVGDQALCEIADRISSSVRPGDTVCRL